MSLSLKDDIRLVCVTTGTFRPRKTAQYRHTTSSQIPFPQSLEHSQTGRSLPSVSPRRLESHHPLPKERFDVSHLQIVKRRDLIIDY